MPALAALSLLLSASCAAQAGPSAAPAVPASSGPAVAQSTAAAVGVSSSAVAGSSATVTTSPLELGTTAPIEEAAQPEQPPEHPIRVHVHREAAHWKPIGLRTAAEDPATFMQIKTAFTRKIRASTVKGKRVLKGEPSRKVKATARLHKVGEDLLLVVSVYPASLRSLRKHMEVRYRLVEGFLEEVQVAAVTIRGGAPSPEDESLDAVALEKRGIEFREDFPGSGQVRVTAIDAKVSKRAYNVATVRKAEFGDRELGTVDLTYFAKGLAAGDASLAPKKPKKGKARSRRKKGKPAKGPSPA